MPCPVCCAERGCHAVDCSMRPEFQAGPAPTLNRTAIRLAVLILAFPLGLAAFVAALGLLFGVGRS